MPFADGHYVRRHPPMLRRKHLPGPAESGNNLVCDEHNAVPGADFTQHGPVLVSRHGHAHWGRHGLGNDGANAFRTMKFDQALYGSCTADGALRRGAPAVLAAVGQGLGPVDHARVGRP